MGKIVRYAFYFLFATIPLIFTTINYELFEFPKFVLLLAVTIVIALAWLFHALTSNDWYLPKSPLNFAILAFLISQTISTVFSIHPYTSFWGYYSRFHQGLLTTICYTILFFAWLKFMDKKSTITTFKIIIATSLAVAVYGILEHFGIDKNMWVQDVQSRVFSTLGQPNWLATYLIPPTFLTLFLYLQNPSKKNAPLTKYIHPLLFGIFFLTILYTKSRSGFLALISAYLLFWGLIFIKHRLQYLRQFLVVSGIMAVIALGIGTPFTPKISDIFFPPSPTPTSTVATNTPPPEYLITESGDIRKIVWTGALELFKNHPIIGTGVETFAYTYYWVRPTSHNLVSEWDFLYNKAHNEYLNLAANSGILGLGTNLMLFLFFGILTYKAIRNRKSPAVLESAIAAGLLATAISNFFGFSVIPVAILLYLLPASVITLAKEKIEDQAASPTANFIFALFAPPLLFFPYQIYKADLNYNNGRKLFESGSIIQSAPLLESAIKMRGNVDLYYSTYAEVLGSTTVALAVQSEEKRNPQVIREYEVATLQALRKTKELNPYHLNFYKTRAKVYLTLASINPDYHSLAAEEIETALNLAPTDAKLAYNLGLVYSRLGDKEKTERYLKKSIELKPDYEAPYYALTLYYEEQKNTAAIPGLLQEAETNLATFTTLREKIDKYLPK